MLSKRKHQVRLYVQDGPTIEGVLAARTRSDYVIWAAKIIHDPVNPPAKAAGHIVVERSRVLYRQVLD